MDAERKWGATAVEQTMTGEQRWIEEEREEIHINFSVVVGWARGFCNTV